MTQPRKRVLAGLFLVVLAATLIVAIYLYVTRPPDVDILTYHGDNRRLGWNTRETVLTPASVTQDSFGKLWQTELEGIVSGNLLFVSGAPINGRKTDTVFAATSTNAVYALDAAAGVTLWQQHLASPVSRLEYSGGGDGTVGIMSTPVIDRKAGLIYVCGVHRQGFRQVHLVWALDIGTGVVKWGPVTIAGAYKGLVHEGGQGIQRGALMLQNGWLYIPFGGRADTPPWHGWVMGIDTRNPNGPQRAFAMSTVTDGGGIWSAGGLSADASGALYAVTGNGEYDLNKGGDDLSQSVLRLTTASGGIAFSRDRKDYYTPANFHHLDEEDEDLGGASALVLPDLPGSSTPHLLFTGGKDGLAYLLNRDSLGGIGGEMQKLPLFYNPKAEYQEGIRATSAYFDAGAPGRFIYVAGDGTGEDGGPGVVALRLTFTPGGAARLEKAWYARCPLTRSDAPVVSSNGAKDAIVWVVDLGNDSSSLRALDAVTGRELYSSAKASFEDQIKDAQPFVSPTVAKGHVYVGLKGVACYGRKRVSKE